MKPFKFISNSYKVSPEDKPNRPLLGFVIITFHLIFFIIVLSACGNQTPEQVQPIIEPNTDVVTQDENDDFLTEEELDTTNSDLVDEDIHTTIEKALSEEPVLIEAEEITLNEEDMPNEAALTEKIEVVDLTGEAVANEKLAMQARFLKNSSGVICYVWHFPSSRTMPYLILTKDQRTNRTSVIYWGKREIDSASCNSTGTEFVFSMRETEDESSDFEIFKYSVSGRKLTMLTNNTTDDTDVSASEDFNTLAWEEDYRGRRAVLIKQVTADKTTYRRSWSRDWTQPSLSSNGDFLVLVYKNNSRYNYIFRYGLKDRRLRYITRGAANVSVVAPSISDDGNSILWLEKSGENNTIKLRDYSARKVSVILTTTNEVNHPYLSRDGLKLAYSIKNGRYTEVNIREIFTKTTTIATRSSLRSFSVVWQQPESSPNKAPEVCFTTSIEEGYSPLEVSIDTSCSKDSDGSITSRSIKLNGKQISTSIKANTLLTNVGEHTIEVTVTDDTGASNSVQKKVKVLNKAPEACFTTNAEEGYAPLAVSIDTSCSTDTDGSIASRSIKLNGEQISTDAKADISLENIGENIIEVTVTDNHGASNNLQKIITVVDTPQSNFQPFSTVAAGSLVSAFVRDGEVSVTGKGCGLGLDLDDVAINQPTKIPNLKNIVSIETSSLMFLALNDQGRVFAWGYHFTGNGERAAVCHPVQVAGEINNYKVVAIATGNEHRLALTEDGRVWVWGHSLENEELGPENPYADVYTPKPLNLPFKVKFISAGTKHSVIVSDDGKAYSFGNNTFAQLGAGKTSKFGSTKGEIYEISNLAGQDIIAVSAGEWHNIALSSTNKQSTIFGYPFSRQHHRFGIPPEFRQVLSNTDVIETNYGRHFIAQGSTLWTWNGKPQKTSMNFDGSRITEISVGYRQTLIKTEDGNVWSMGDNREGQLGLGHWNRTSTPQKISFTDQTPQIYSLTVQRSELGRVKTIRDSNINCGGSSYRHCTAQYLQGVTVILRAEPDSGNEFVGWQGVNCIGSDETETTCEISMSGARTVVAEFRSIGSSSPTPTQPTNGTFNLSGLSDVTITQGDLETISNGAKNISKSQSLTIARSDGFRETINISAESLDGDYFKFFMSDPWLSGYEDSTSLKVVLENENIPVSVYRIRVSASGDGFSTKTTDFKITVEDKSTTSQTGYLDISFDGIPNNIGSISIIQNEKIIAETTKTGRFNLPSGTYTVVPKITRYSNYFYVGQQTYLITIQNNRSTNVSVRYNRSFPTSIVPTISRLSTSDFDNLISILAQRKKSGASTAQLRQVLQDELLKKSNFSSLRTQQNVGQYTPNDLEIAEIDRDPFAGLVLGSNALNAQLAQALLFRESWLGKGDAFRHTYWNALSVEELRVEGYSKEDATETVVRFTAAHECFDWGKIKYDETCLGGDYWHNPYYKLQVDMDLKNNYQGRLIGNRIYDQENGNTDTMRSLIYRTILEEMTTSTNLVWIYGQDPSNAFTPSEKQACAYVTTEAAIQRYWCMVPVTYGPSGRTFSMD